MVHEEDKNQPWDIEFQYTSKGTTLPIGNRTGELYRRIFFKTDRKVEDNYKEQNITEEKQTNKEITKETKFFTRVSYAK